MDVDPRKAKELFLAALERPAGDDRACYLDVACEGSSDLRHRVEVLLMAHDQPGTGIGWSDEVEPKTTTLWDGPVSRPGAADPKLAALSDTTISPGDAEAGRPTSIEPEGLGSWVGPFRLLQVLGRGGMGVVYKAAQEKPIRRHVALKLIRPGMDSAQVVARFEAERQALAMMDHPNIADVFDAGQTASGLPYVVMELVPGVPITQYCDEARLTLPERLELFITVCEAIQHAHQKGIIHRDVKPSNILVTSHEGGPVVKVIDFGIAKSVDQRLTDRSLLTEVGSILGTLEYMSPEQAEMGASGVDTRTDVYALGILLYELMVGSTPLERARLRGLKYDEILRSLREEESRKPSAHLVDLGESIAPVAASRKLEPSKLVKAVRGDLDWIALKALRKDRRRRYETASALARDIRRHLGGHPVEACPPGVGYVFGKFLRRHRGAVAAASIAVLALVGGIVGTSLGLVRALDARRAAEASERDAQAVVSFFQESILAAARPQGTAGGLGKDVTLRQAIDKIAPTIHESFKDRPLVEAALSRYIGDTYTYLSEFATATPYFERAYAVRRAILGLDNPDTFTSMQDLGDNYLDLLREDLALPMFRELKEGRARLFGPDDPRTLHTDLLLGRTYFLLGDTRAFVPTLAVTLAKLRARDPRGEVTMRCLAWLGVCMDRAGDPVGAIPLLEEAVDVAQDQFTADHMLTRQYMGYLSSAYLNAGEMGKAIAILEETLEWQRKHLGPAHLDVIRSLSDLTFVYVKAGLFDKALEAAEAERAVATATHGPDYYTSIACDTTLGAALLGMGRPDRALPYFESSYARSLPRRPPDHLEILQLLLLLGSAHAGVGDVARATREHRHVADRSEARFGAGHPLTFQAMDALGWDLLDAGSPGQAFPLFDRAWRLARGRLGADSPDALHCRHSVASAYVWAGSPERALPIFRECLARRKVVLGDDHPDTLATADDLGECLIRLHNAEEAEAILRDNLGRRESKDAGHWRTSWTRSLLGAALASRRAFVEAEPLAVSSYEAMKARLSEIPARERPRLAEAAGRIVALYEAWNKPEKADPYRAALRPAIEVIGPPKP